MARAHRRTSRRTLILVACLSASCSPSAYYEGDPAGAPDSKGHWTTSIHDEIIFSREKEYVRSRRRAAGVRAGREKSIGIAFSGGGLRSATFNLGVLQGLQESGLLREADYLSTVSGGGYIGTWYVTHLLRPGEAPMEDEKGYLSYHPDPAFLLADCDDRHGPKGSPIYELEEGRWFVHGENDRKLPGRIAGWVARMPANLIFDVGLHYKPTRGKFNWHHPFYVYRSAIAETYLAPPKNETRAKGSVAPRDLLAEINPPGSTAPYLILNSALANDRIGLLAENPDPKSAKDKFKNYRRNHHFEFTREFCGSPDLGFIETEYFDKPVVRVHRENGVPKRVVVKSRPWPILRATKPFSTASAATASGAAFDSAGGRFRTLSDLLFKKPLNLNLRYQTRNFAQSLSGIEARPLDRLREVTQDRFGPPLTANSLYLSDGGHYCNLGVPALVRRGVEQMWVFDASQDKKYTFGSLKKSMVAVQQTPCPRCERDLAQCSLRWTFDRRDDGDYENGKFFYQQPEKSGPKDGLHDPVKRGWIRSRCGRYQAEVWYCKSSFRPDYYQHGFKIAGNLKRWIDNTTESFPHTSTILQRYRERERFNAYRELGRYVSKRMAREK